MNAAKPAWREVFDKVERAVGRPLEEVVASPTYIDVIATGIRVQRAVTGTVGWVVAGAVGGVLRAVNIPTRTDVLRLQRQLATLATEVRALDMAQQTPPRAPARVPVPPALTTQDGDHDG